MTDSLLDALQYMIDAEDKRHLRARLQQFIGQTITEDTLEHIVEQVLVWNDEWMDDYLEMSE